MNVPKTQRDVEVSSLVRAASEGDQAAWDALPEERVLGRECVDVVREAIAALPPRLREVMTLRDVAGWSSREVAEALGITEENQRVRLHRARARVRSALEGYIETPGASA